MPTEPTKVLIVDDDPAMLRLLAKWIEAEGFRVLRASDGRMAIDLIEAERPRLLVADLEMPNLNGLELCRWIRGQNLGYYLYTVFLTVRTDSGDMLKGLEAGADDFLKKPVDRNELLARIRAGSRVMELEQRLSVLEPDLVHQLEHLVGGQRGDRGGRVLGGEQRIDAAIATRPRELGAQACERSAGAWGGGLGVTVGHGALRGND